MCSSAARNAAGADWKVGSATATAGAIPTDAVSTVKLSAPKNRPYRFIKSPTCSPLCGRIDPVDGFHVRIVTGAGTGPEQCQRNHLVALSRGLPQIFGRMDVIQREFRPHTHQTSSPPVPTSTGDGQVLNEVIPNSEWINPLASDYAEFAHTKYASLPLPSRYDEAWLSAVGSRLCRSG